jgi:LysM repeat protein
MEITQRAGLHRRRHPLRPRPVRLTRRGRVVVIAVLVGILIGVFAIASSPGRAATPSGAHQVAVVQPGDTLWSIAERFVPGRDPIETIDEIRRLNGLEGSTVHPGQHLLLPVRR